MPIHHRAPPAACVLGSTISVSAQECVAQRVSGGSSHQRGLYGRQDRSAEHRGNLAYLSAHEIPSVKRSGFGWPCARRIRAAMIGPAAGQASAESATAPSGARKHPPLTGPALAAACCSALSASSNANSVGFRNRPEGVVTTAVTGRVLRHDSTTPAEAVQAHAFATATPDVGLIIAPRARPDRQRCPHLAVPPSRGRSG